MSDDIPCIHGGHNYIEVNDNHVGCSVNAYRWKCSICNRLYKHKEEQADE